MLPQHFQRQELHVEEKFAEAARVDAPFSYGIRELEIEESAFENWQLVVHKVSGRTKAGTLFQFEEGEIGRLDLRTCDDGEARKQLESNQQVTFYLAFPINKPNAKNVSVDDAQSRYHEFEESVFDLQSGSNDRDIVFKKLRAVLCTTDARSLDYDYLPLGKLSLASSENGQVPKISDTYHPPSTQSLSTTQSRKMYREMENQLTAYLLRLIEYLNANGFGISGIANQEISEAVYRYCELSGFRGWLISHNQSPGFHPFQNFQSMCQTIGRLAIVDPSEERLVDYQRYDHDDVYSSLKWAWDRIQRCFVDPGKSRIVRIPLVAETMQTEVGEDVIMAAVIPAEMFDPDYWHVYLAFDYNFGRMTKEDANQLFNVYLTDASQFYWKLGAQDSINRYFVNREQGVWFENPSRSKPDLPRQSGWIYVDILKDEYWDAVKRSGTICMRIDQENLRTPKSDLGTEKVTVGINQRTYQYRVSVFAVKQNV